MSEALLGTIVGGILAIISGVIGIILTNRHSLKIEYLKARQEKVQKIERTLEDVYQSLMFTDDLCDSLCYDAINGDIPTRSSDQMPIDIVGRIKEIRSNLSKTTTLVRLYLPFLRESSEVYRKNIESFWNIVGHLYALRVRRENNTPDFDQQFNSFSKDYKDSLQSLYDKIEVFSKEMQAKSD